MSNKVLNSKNGRAALRLAALLFTFFFAADTWCRPDMTPLGPNIADKGSAFYRFSVSTFDSADGSRHYKVWTGVPNKNPPPSGFPVMYLLDGNATMDRLSETLLQQLSAHNPPVIVAVGYQTAEPFDLLARNYDYTPLIKDNRGQPVQFRGRQGGGDARFRQLLTEKIVPQAEKGLKINADERGIWGHSLGGVFVLNTYLSSPLFHFYYPTSPTLNQQYGGVLTQLTASDTRCNKRLYVIEGNGLPGKNPQAPTPDVLNKVRATLASLQKEGLTAAYWSDPQLSHGQTFNTGLQQALLHLSRQPEEQGICLKKN
ncbi:alpha/beta hydrolase [Kalamiella sp. sgz302252]|uniref:alpha/beta hydrolase n=1 Tax=Pantoea sp. sgz302252 TaxID=3341827 RepID=UPI0036D28DB3